MIGTSSPSLQLQIPRRCARRDDALIQPRCGFALRAWTDASLPRGLNLGRLDRLAGVVARARRVHRASLTLSSSVLLASCIFVQQSLTAATTCEDLLRTSLPGGAITSAQTVAAGRFNPRAEGGGFGGGPAPNYSALPAFCRVQASLRPSPDSDIQIELWMPASSEWNGKFFGVGNGGLGGGAEVSPVGLANALRMGYAASGNNTGHAGDSRYALDHPEKIKDFGYRSVHEMTVAAKALIREYYGRSPKLSYTAGAEAARRRPSVLRSAIQTITTAWP